MNKDYLLIGKFVGVHGIKGEVKLLVFGADSGAIDEGATRLPWKDLFTEVDGALKHFKVTKSRMHKGIFLLTLTVLHDDGSEELVVTRNDSEALRQLEIYVLKSDLPNLKDDYYLYELVDFEVLDSHNNIIGKFKDMTNNGAQDLYVVDDLKGDEILIPAVDGALIEIDTDKKRIILNVPPGLIE